MGFPRFLLKFLLLLEWFTSSSIVKNESRLPKYACCCNAIRVPIPWFSRCCWRVFSSFAEHCQMRRPFWVEWREFAPQGHPKFFLSKSMGHLFFQVAFLLGPTALTKPVSYKLHPASQVLSEHTWSPHCNQSPSCFAILQIPLVRIPLERQRAPWLLVGGSYLKSTFSSLWSLFTVT